MHAWRLPYTRKFKREKLMRRKRARLAGAKNKAGDGREMSNAPVPQTPEF
jgi:hypothetical protein